MSLSPPPSHCKRACTIPVIWELYNNTCPNMMSLIRFGYGLMSLRANEGLHLLSCWMLEGRRRSVPLAQVAGQKRCSLIYHTPQKFSLPKQFLIRFSPHTVLDPGKRTSVHLLQQWTKVSTSPTPTLCRLICKICKNYFKRHTLGGGAGGWETCLPNMFPSIILAQPQH